MVFLVEKKNVAEQRADAINKNGGKAIALIADVLDENQLREDKMKKRFSILW